MVLNEPQSTYYVSEFSSLEDNQARELSLTWDGLLTQLRTPRPATHKKGVPLYSPARYRDLKRAKVQVIDIGLFVVDVDNKQDGEPVLGRHVAKALAERELRSVIATSWSHTPEKPKFRVLIPLARPVSGLEWSTFAPAAVEAAGLAPFRHAFDQAALKNPACIYFWPSSPAGQPQVVDFAGKALEVQVPQAPSPAPKHKVHLLPTAPRGGGEYGTLDVAAWFQHHGLYIKASTTRAKMHIVACPWRDDHTNPGEVGTGTAIFDGDGATWPSFECKHDHCTGRRIHDVIALWGDADRFCSAPYQQHEQEAKQARSEELKHAADPAGYKPPAGALPSDGNLVPYVWEPKDSCPQGFPASIPEVFRRYVYVSGLGQVIDRRRGNLMKPEDLEKTLKGRKYFSEQRGWSPLKFFNEDAKKMVHKEDVIFRPGTKVGPDKINLFTGFEQHARPVIDKPELQVQRILELLAILCGGEMDYVLSWLAYPVRFPGAKMPSALIVHGAQGTGKSLLFDQVMRQVYGRWSVKINQSDLEAGWTGWMSKRLYAVAEEVVARRDRPQVSGLIKDWITGDRIQVNEKNVPIREEENHCNFVFLSNEMIPMLLDQDDRRFCVVSIREHGLPITFFKELLAEFWATQGAAWFQYLERYPVPESFIRSGTPANAAKRALKEACKSSAEAFLDEWLCKREDGTEDLAAAKRGENALGLPLQAARSADIYRAYRTYCMLDGVKASSQKIFVLSALIPRGFTRLKTELANTFLPPGESPPAAQVLGAQCAEFRAAAAALDAK